MSAILTEYDIAYVKWDMNRDLTHAGSEKGIANVHRQTEAVYALMDRIRFAFPMLEIESCASGGGRADFGILQRADRIWTSDNNDAHDRISIQNGASLFLPLSILGSHVGAFQSHITGRCLPMELRAAVALFGHMGLEIDLQNVSADDFILLSKYIHIYKQKRALLHGGNLFHLDCDQDICAHGVVSENKKEAFWLVAMMRTRVAALPPRLRFIGLDSARMYTLRLLSPSTNRIEGNESVQSIVDKVSILESGVTLSGAFLMKAGIQLHVLIPNRALLFEMLSSSE